MYNWMLKGHCLKSSFKEYKNELTTLLRVDRKIILYLLLMNIERMRKHCGH